MKIKDISLATYLQLKDTSIYDRWLIYVTSKNTLQGKISKTKSDFTFDEVSFLKLNFSKEQNEENLKTILDICFLEKIDLENLTLFDYYSWSLYLVEELEGIIKIENSISVDSDSILKLAGIDELRKYGDLNTKIQLGEQFGKLPNEIGQMLWQDVIVILMYNADKVEIEKKYVTLKNKIK